MPKTELDRKIRAAKRELRWLRMQRRRENCPIRRAVVEDYREWLLEPANGRPPFYAWAAGRSAREAAKTAAQEAARRKRNAAPAPFAWRLPSAGRERAA